MDTKSHSFAYVSAPFKTSHGRLQKAPLAPTEPAPTDATTLELIKEGESLVSQAKARLASKSALKPAEKLPSLAEAANRDDVKALDTIRLEMRALLRGHLSKIYALQWASDSRTVVSASQDGKMIVWDAHKAFKLFLIPLESAWVMTCAFSPSASLVACGGLDNACTIYSLRNVDGTARLHRCLHDAHDAFVSCCRFVEEHKILTASGDKSIGCWDVEKRTRVGNYVGHTGGVMSVALPRENASGEQVFISGACDATAKLWDLRADSGKKACVATYTGHRDDINDVKFFPSGTAFATGSDDGSCRLYDLRTTNQSIATYHHKDCSASNLEPTEITSIDFSSSGRLLFAGDNQLKCTLWDTMREERAGVLAGHSQRVSCLGVAKDCTAVCTGSWDGLLRVWN